MNVDLDVGHVGMASNGPAMERDDAAGREGMASASVTNRWCSANATKPARS